VSVLVIDPSADDYLRLLSREFPGIDVRVALERGAVGSEIETASVLIGLPPAFSDDLVQRASRLEWIQLLSSGTDVLRRLPSLRPGVVVTSTQGVHAPPVSEMAFLHMLAVALQYDRTVRNRALERWEKPPQPLLCGRTVVILDLTPRMGGEAAPYAGLVWRILRHTMACHLEGRPFDMLNRIARGGQVNPPPSRPEQPPTNAS